MALPTIIAGLTKLITTAFQYRMAITRQFQERMSEIGMALFIASNTEDFDTVADYLQMQQIIIKAYCKFLGIPAIYSLFGEEIMQNKVLDRFFDDFRSYNEFKAYYLETGLTYNPDLELEEQLRNIINLTPIPGLANALSKYVNNPTELWIDLSREIWRLMEAQKKGSYEVLNFIDQHFKDAPSPIEEYLPHPTTCLLLHPTAGLDWAVLKAFIATQMAYIDYMDAIEDRLVRRPHIWYGTRNVWATTEVKGRKYLKIVRGTFEKPEFWVGEHETISAVRGWGKNQKQYDLKITNIQDVAKLNFMLTGDLKLKEYMPKAKRFFLTIREENIFDEYTLKREDIREVKIKLEHEGVFSNEIKAIFMKNYATGLKVEWGGYHSNFEAKCLPDSNGIISQGTYNITVRPGYAVELRITQTDYDNWGSVDACILLPDTDIYYCPLTVEVSGSGGITWYDEEGHPHEESVPFTLDYRRYSKGGDKLCYDHRFSYGSQKWFIYAWGAFKEEKALE